MVETKEVKKDSLQETGKAPAGGDGNTPPEVYTAPQLEEALQKDRIERGRDAKTLDQRETTVKAREDAIKSREDAAKAGDERRDAAELAEAQKDPDTLAAYQAKQVERQRTRKQDERDVAQDKREAEHAAKITAAEEGEREILIHEVATAKGIDPMRLKTLSEKFNVEGKEKLEEMAGEIAAGKFKDFEADTAMTKGTKTDLSSLSADEKLNRGFSDVNKKK